MTHYYDAGLQTIATITKDWVLKNISGEDALKYFKFESFNSREIKAVKLALRTFCPKATQLGDFFKKVVLVSICNEERFKALSIKQQLVIVSFRDQLVLAGLTPSLAENFFGLGFVSLKMVSLFGTKLNYSIVQETEVRAATPVGNAGAPSAFTSFRAKSIGALDVVKMSRFLVHFVHSCDASIVQSQAKAFHARNSGATLCTVHDCFGVTFDLFCEESSSVKEQYFVLGLDDNESVLRRCVLEPCILRGSNVPLENAVFSSLTAEYANLFPKAQNILANNKENVLNSCYWYPLSF